MSLRIQTNIEAFDAHRNLVSTQNQLATSMEKLSSGFRINRAADDAAGLAISEKLQAQIGGLDQAQRNAQDAVSLVQTGEGALAEVQSMLQRVRDLAVQFNNGTLAASDQAAITAEVAQLCAEISDIGSQTAFNGITLLNGGGSITFQVGANDGETLNVSTVALFGSGTSDRSTRRSSASRAPSPCPRSTPRSRTSPAPAAPSARYRTGSTTGSTTSPPTRRTSPHPSPGSRTWTWPAKWSTSQAPDPEPGRHRNAGTGKQRPTVGAEPPPLTPSGNNIEGRRDRAANAAPCRSLSTHIARPAGADAPLRGARDASAPLSARSASEPALAGPRHTQGPAAAQPRPHRSVAAATPPARMSRRDTSRTRYRTCPGRPCRKACSG